MEISKDERYYISLIKNTDKVLNIFDVGCNKGFYTEYLLNTIGENHNYYLFDPSERFYNIVSEKFKMFDNIHIKNIGVSDLNKENINFYELISDNDDVEGMSSLNNRKVFSNYEYKTNKINTISLDSFISEQNINNIDFIKIDTEGQELKILNGLKDSLNKKIINLIQIEYGDCAIENGFNLNDIITFISQYDYNLYVYDLDFTEVNSHNSDNYINLPWCNFLIVRNG
jgi:FkbM family methyltransferase